MDTESSNPSIDKGSPIFCWSPGGLFLPGIIRPTTTTSGLKFTTDDLDSDALMWELYETWGARYHVLPPSGITCRKNG